MKRILAALLGLMLMCGQPLACADVDAYDLPAALTEVQAEAFRNNDEVTEVILHSQVTAIGDYAFADCAKLREVTIPSGVTSIGEGIFSGCRGPLLINTSAGSTAMQYALNNGLDFQADTVYRALLVAQSDYQTYSSLAGPLTDVTLMRRILTEFYGTPYTVSTVYDQTAAGIRSAIASTFAGAGEQDVSLFYYSGHGASGSGALVGVDGSSLDGADLRAALDAIPGRKVVIVDACHSGALIGKSTAGSGNGFVSAFMSGFRRSLTGRSANLAADRYYVITAAHSSEISAELEDGPGSFGCFTCALAKGCGYDYVQEQSCDLMADSNEDGVITLYEAYSFARAGAKQWHSAQTAQIWPDNCSAFGFLR